MRNQLFAVVIGFVLFVVVLFIPSPLKKFLGYSVVAVSAVGFVWVMLRKAPVYCQCSRCAETIYRFRAENTGRSFLCQDCKARIRVPRVSISQILKQNLLTSVLGRDVEDLAIPCPVVSN